MIRKLAIIGLDGATFDLILPWAESGDLPNFKRLMTDGAWGPLRSTIHPLSPQAWTTFATGKNAGKHGIFDFLVKCPGTYRFALTHGGYRREPTLWHLLSRAGKRVIAINVPFTYPPEPVNGVMISGFDAPRADKTLSYPPDAYAQVLASIGSYYLHEMYPVGYRMCEYEEVLRREIENRVQVTRYFVKRYEWDFYMIVIMATDLVQHLFWAELEDPLSPFAHLIKRVYQMVDAAIEELETLLGDDVTLLVISDHGAGPIRRSIYLNEWLRTNGWLAYDERITRAGKRVISTGMDAVRKAMKRYLPRQIKDWLKQGLPGVRNRAESWIRTSDIDWGRTRAFSGGQFGNIYLNVCGREPQGIVCPGYEQNRLLDEITAALLEMCDPDTGEPIVEAVHRREELYSGPYLDLAPDLVIQWRDYSFFTISEPSIMPGQIFAPPPAEDATEFRHSGTHRLNGILLAYGPGICPGELTGANIVDLAPTILHALGLPVPEDMEGQILESMLHQRTPVKFVAPSSTYHHNSSNIILSAYSRDEENEVVERLRTLGYID